MIHCHMIHNVNQALTEADSFNQPAQAPKQRDWCVNVIKIVCQADTGAYCPWTTAPNGLHASPTTIFLA